MADDELSRKLSRRLQLNEEKNPSNQPEEGDQAVSHNHLAKPDDQNLQRKTSSCSSTGSDKEGISDSASDELSKKLSRRQDINEGSGDYQPHFRVQNPYTEFKEFSRKQVKEYEKKFKE